MDAMEKRRQEIEAKKAKLLELKKQRELRRQGESRSSTAGPEMMQPSPIRTPQLQDIDAIISGIRERSSSTRPDSPAQRGTPRPISVISSGQQSTDNEGPTFHAPSGMVDREMQTLSIAPLQTVYESNAELKKENQKEYITYSKGVQASIDWSPQKSRGVGDSDSEGDQSPTRSPRSKRLNRRQKEREEEIRSQLKKELEEELKAAQSGAQDLGAGQSGTVENFPFRTLTDEELNAVENSEDFSGFVDRAAKVVERALDQELGYDILADYAHGGAGVDEEDEGYGSSGGKKGRRVKEIAQFWDERWSKKRMISDLGFSTKFPELVLASYTKNPSAPHDPDGLVQVWNMHMHDRPEYIFHAQSDILTAKFSPFHPNLIIGGAYSGQVLLWDTRAKGTAPVQKTPLTGSGHTHPVYSLDIVGTQNANNIISCSTDGVVCGWTIDMLSQPQEFLELSSPPPAKTEDMAVTCLAFPQSDPTYFLAGTEEGSIYPCHRYDRAGAKAGVDTRVKYSGHAAPVMSLDFHPTKGQIDLGDLVLSSSVDWSVKLWKVRPPAATGTANTSAPGATQNVTPILDIAREDLVYDARWSPVKPSVFALVDGAGSLEVWDINVDVEVPVQKVSPSDNKRGAFASMPSGLGYMNRSLNKLAWERNEGRRVAVGGMDGVVTVFEVGQDLGGLESTRGEEWTGVKRLMGKLEGVGEPAVNGK